MALNEVANIGGAVILLVSGLAALILPGVLANLLVAQVESRGRAELRINFGAFWVGLAAAALIFNQKIGYQVLGAGWAAIVIVRFVAYFVDRPQPMRLYWLLWVGEIITAMLLFV